MDQQTGESSEITEYYLPGSPKIITPGDIKL